MNRREMAKAMALSPMLAAATSNPSRRKELRGLLGDLRGRIPAVLYNHAHGGTFKLGKLELAEGRSHLVKPSYAERFTGLGYAVLCSTVGIRRASGQNASVFYGA